jgi:hypothetical protein
MGDCLRKEKYNLSGVYILLCCFSFLSFLDDGWWHAYLHQKYAYFYPL